MLSPPPFICREYPEKGGECENDFELLKVQSLRAQTPRVATRVGVASGKPERLRLAGSDFEGRNFEHFYCSRCWRGGSGENDKTGINPLFSVL